MRPRIQYKKWYRVAKLHEHETATEVQRRMRTAARYGLTADELEAIAHRQGNRCGICGRARVLVVDHDHKTGLVRGLLCYSCNVGLGQFKDDEAKLAKAIIYLKHHRVFRSGTPD